MTFPNSSRSMLTAMLCAAAVTAQFVGGKATRDALFLGALNFTALPAMLIATAGFSILLVGVNSQLARRISPASLVPASFAASGVLLLGEWLLTYRAGALAAVIVYLHISGAGPVLGSGFWLIASERFDPRTAKKRFGQIAGAGTLGGLVGAMLAERVATLLGVAAMLPFLAVFHLYAAWQVRRLAVQSEADGRASSRPVQPSPPAPPRSGLRVLAEAPYLRNLALLVLLGTTSVALVDYVFKARAVEMFGRGENLLRFFAIYYAATSLITFVLQTSASRFALERFGLALTTSTPSFALFAGGVGSLVAPGFASVMVARSAEAVFRGSLFRSGYELFFTPIPAAEKRAAKAIVDVGFDRLGDAVGGGLVRAALLVAPVTAQFPTILGLGMACSAGAILAASRLNRGYIRTLEKSLLNRAVEIDLSDVEDGTTRTLMIGTLGRTRVDLGLPRQDEAEFPRPVPMATSGGLDPDLEKILRLRSRDRDDVVKVLRTDEGISRALVPHVISLLAWDPVAEDAVFALRKVAEERVGELTDALIDPNQDFAIRRRLARVFAVCVSQRATDGLMLGLDDLRFEVRFQCGRSLASILDKNPTNRIDREQIFAVVLREAAVGRPVWESRRLLDELDASDSAPAVDAFVRDRAGQSLAHVFTLLSLVLPREPLQIAFRSMFTDDRQLQGTALEYLVGILPPPIRQRLWPFLEDRRPARISDRPRQEIVDELLRSNASIMLNLEELRRRGDAEV
jgi:hypothetical protein